MANALSLYGFVMHRNLADESTPLETVYTTSNTTFRVGDPIRLTTTGLAVKSTAASTKLGFIYGFAVEPITAKAATSYPMKIVPALPHVVFRAACASTLNVTKGYVGRGAGIKVSGVYFGIAVGSPTLSQVQIIGLASGSSYGTYAEMLCIVKHSAFIGQIT